MSRIERAEKARQTLEYFQKGSYVFGENTVKCKNCFTSEFVSEKQLKALQTYDGNFTPKYEVVNESVVDTIFRLGGNCGVLNFASAKNPGGGFLNGAMAQEEALAISSDLYNSQLQIPQYYENNRKYGTALYTHNMIYSRNITFIRDSSLNTVQFPVNVNILTSPAVNAGAYYKNENGSKSTVLNVMETRMRYILKLFAARGDRKIILGAYGCGVFANEAVDVAYTFRKLLKDEKLERQFEYISFAVYDSKGQQYRAFRRTFTTT